MRRYVTLYGIAAAGVILALLGTVARGRSPLSVLGAYRAATGSGYSVSSVLHYLLWHTAELDLYVGVAGFAALFAMWLAPRGIAPRRACVRCGVGARGRAAPARGRDLRLASVGTHRGAKRLLPRADRADRDARAARARRRTCVAPRADRRRARCRRASGRGAVRALRQHLGDLRHARVAALVVGAGSRHSLRPAAAGGPRRRTRRRSRGRASCPGGRRSSSRSRRASTSCSPPLSSRTAATASARHRRGRSSQASASRIQTGSTAPSGAARTSRSSGTTRARPAPSGTTSSSTGACAPSTRSTGPTPRTAACPRRRCTSEPTGRS